MHNTLPFVPAPVHVRMSNRPEVIEASGQFIDLSSTQLEEALRLLDRVVLLALSRPHPGDFVVQRSVIASDDGRGHELG